MANQFDLLTAAVEKARMQFSPTYGAQEGNVEVIKELGKELVSALACLIYEGGGDNDYFEPWADALPSDIDACFQSEFRSQTMFKARRGLSMMVRA